MKNQDDREFIGRIRKAWGRPQLSAAEAARFDLDLRERLAGRRRFRWIPMTALAAAAAAIALVIMVPGRPKTSPEAVPLVETLGQAQEIAFGNGLNWGETTSGTEAAPAGWPGDYDPEAALNTLLNTEYQALAFLVAPPES